MTHRTHPSRARCALAAALALSAHALAQSDDRLREPTTTTTNPGAAATLIDRQLRVRSIRIAGLDAVELTVIDERGERRQVPLSELVAIVPTPATPAALTGVGTVVGVAEPDADALTRRITAGDAGFVLTVDGQRLIGQPGSASADSDSITWVHPAFGPVRIELERLLTLAMPNAGALALTLERDAAEDVLTLINGDRLRGLVASLGDPVVVETETGARFEVERASVAGATLANPPEPRAGAVAWLKDGTVIRVAAASSAAGDIVDLALESGAESAYAIGDLRALGLDAECLLPLSDLTPEAQVGPIERRTVPPVSYLHHPDDLAAGANPTLGALDIRFPGPMRVDWRLPRRALRIAATAALAKDAAPWGDCEIVVSVDGQERFRDHLESGGPVIAINEEILGGQVLTISIEPGAYGPINDRVILHRPLILLDAPR